MMRRYLGEHLVGIVDSVVEVGHGVVGEALHVVLVEVQREPGSHPKRDQSMEKTREVR
jgi:hypothetical protein